MAGQSFNVQLSMKNEKLWIPRFSRRQGYGLTGKPGNDDKLFPLSLAPCAFPYS
jgi:hypothetical protein